jgi:Rieske Fe-S protein
MDRKHFIKTCGVACMGGIGITTLVPGCGTSRWLHGKIAGDDLIVPVDDFQINKGKQNGFRRSLIIQHDRLQYPICVFRFSENEYAALWMRCTHQGTELQVFGDTLQCPAHGSEFTNKGMVQSGPADAKLRTFPVTLENNQLKISLKAT